MPNFANVLKNEICRLARKEAKKTEKSLKDTVSFLRQTVLSQKKKIAELEKEVSLIMKKSGVSGAVEVSNPEEVEKSRFSPGLISRLRAKLDLSRTEMAALVGVNANSIFLWEKGQTSPRFAAKARLLELRSLGKRELKKRLAAMKIAKGEDSDADTGAKAGPQRAAKKKASATKLKKQKKAKKAAATKAAKSKASAKKSADKGEQQTQPTGQTAPADASAT